MDPKEILYEIMKNGLKFLVSGNEKYLIEMLSLCEILKKRGYEGKVAETLQKWKLEREKMLEVKEGYDFWAEFYGKNPIARINLEILKEILPKNLKGKKVLDAGCGTGILCKYLKENGAKVYGIDVSEKMIEIAKKKVPEGEFFVGDIRKLPFKENFFDIIICSLVLCHLENIEEALKEFRRVLKKDGILIISDIHPSMTRKGYIFIHDTEIKVKVYPKRLRNYIEKIGKYFKIELFEEYYSDEFEETRKIFGMDRPILIVFKCRHASFLPSAKNL